MPSLDFDFSDGMRQSSWAPSSHTLWLLLPEFQHSSGTSRGYTSSKMPQPSFDAK